MADLTPEHLRAIMPRIPQRDEYTEFDACCATMRRFHITTKQRAAAWFMNVAKESGELFYTEEIWGPTATQAGYEGRQDLGNTQPGDGFRFKGRGYIQITGRANYTTIAQALKIACVNNPELLEQMPHRWTTAGYFWENMARGGTWNLNEVADTGDFAKTVLGVRGGPDPDRHFYYNRAMSVLPDDLTIPDKDLPPVSKQTTPSQLAEKAIDFGMEMIGTAYGPGWKAGTWPELSPLYSRITRHDEASWYKARPCVCSAFINVLRFEIAELPAIGRKQGDPFPGGTAAIHRVWGRMRGARPYPLHDNTPRGWLVYSPYIDSPLALQGHVGIALGDGRVLEARVPSLSANRTENEGHVALKAGGAQGYTLIIPPSIWMVA